MARKHHYVPRFLLRRFSHDGGSHLHAYDTRDQRQFAPNITNVAHENDFNEFVLGDYFLSIEEWLAAIESMAAPPIERLLASDTLANSPPMDRAAICHFAAVQFARTAAFRNRMRDAFTQMHDALDKKMTALGNVDTLDLGALCLSDPEQRELACQQVLEAPQKFAEHFATKAWVLLATMPDHPFVIGDNPVALHNTRSFPLGGNLGLAVPGIEIYLPLSPTRALCFMCPTHMANAAIASHAVDGRILRRSAEEVDSINAIQILNADRFVFSLTPDFALVERVTGSHTAAVCRPRFKCR